MARKLLTAELGDILLEYIHANFPVRQQVTYNQINNMLAATGLEFNELDAYLDEFQRKGLIGGLSLRQVAVSFHVNRELDAFLEAGGLSGELSKLKSELEVLQAKLDNQNLQESKDLSATIHNVLQIAGKVTFGLLGKY